MSDKYIACPICGKTVKHALLQVTEPITGKDGRQYVLEVYWPAKYHRDETGHDSTVSFKVYVEET